MKIRFKEPFTAKVITDICGFSGDHKTVERHFAADETLESVHVSRGEKQKGGRILTVAMDDGRIQPDRFTVPERIVEIIEEESP